MSGSIRTKLLASTVAVIAAIVAVTTLYFRHQELASLYERQQSRLRMYSAMLSFQTRSVVAFADQATAREVLDSLRADPDVVSVVLFGGDGERLFERGTPSRWVDKAAAGVIDEKIVDADGRDAVVTPVISLEGPRGTLVIELSRARILARGREITRLAVIAACIAVLFGFCAVMLITQPMLRRLRRLADVAGSVSGDLPDGVAVEVDSGDELGAVGAAFNTMVERLRAEQQRLRDAITDLTEQEQRLEARFQRRTESLRNLNSQLRVEMERRTQIEIELRQAQKLESVGRLAAGIAHEINTPVQFVSDSCAFVQNAAQDMVAVIEQYRALVHELGAQDRADGIESEHDLPYVIEQVPLAIERSLQGLERVSTIVKSMKEFAHPDQSQAAYADINRAITSTITVARNEYKYVADLETDLGELPMVSCHVGELNQVVLNIVVNAAHAIESVVKGSERRGKIAIRTRAEAGQALIEITDDGCGIPQANLDKIFDPFFTTKEIGKGTGQGLAIARAVIVDKHHGKLTVESELGVGTTFRILLPVMPEEIRLAS